MVEGSPVPEIDRMFRQVERSPYRLPAPGGIINEMGQELWDKIGLPKLLGGMGGIIEMLNPDFETGPPFTTDPISGTTNPLPDWDYHSDAGSWSTTWGANAEGYAGYAVTFTSAAGSTGDTAYLEQETTIFKYRPLVIRVGHSGTDANMRLRITVTWLDATGAALGSPITAYYTTTTDTISALWRIPPDLAFTARVQVGTSAAGNFASPQSRSIWFISKEQPYVYSVNIPGVLSYASPAVSTQYAMPYPSDIVPGGVYKADTRGFVLGISVKTSDTISAGTGTVRVENDTAATNPGPTVALDSGSAAGQATADLDGRYSYDFAPGDELHLELSTDGDYASTGDADYVASARLLLVVNDEADW